MRMCTYWNKVGLTKSKTKKNKKIDSIGIGLASPEEIRRWGERRLPNGTLIGKVDKDHTVDYESLKPIEGGLFCERIFGPVEDFCCSCERRGKKNEKFCPNCEVEFTKSRVRRTRMGYIPLAVPVAHVWYLRGRPSYIANLIGKSRIAVDRLAYGETLCESFSGNTHNPFFRSTSCMPKGSTTFSLTSSQHSAFENPNPCKTNPFKFADLTKSGIKPPTSLTFGMQMNFGTGWRTKNLGDAPQPLLPKPSATFGFPASQAPKGYWKQRGLRSWVCQGAWQAGDSLQNNTPCITFGVTLANFGMKPLPLRSKSSIPSYINPSYMVARPQVKKKTQCTHLSEKWNKGIQQKDLHESHATLTNFYFHKRLRQAISSIKTNCISISNRCPSGFAKQQKNGFNHSYAIPSLPSPLAYPASQAPLLPIPFRSLGCWESEGSTGFWKQWLRSIPKIFGSLPNFSLFNDERDSSCATFLQCQSTKINLSSISKVRLLRCAWIRTPFGCFAKPGGYANLQANTSRGCFPSCGFTIPFGSARRQVLIAAKGMQPLAYSHPFRTCYLSYASLNGFASLPQCFLKSKKGLLPKTKGFYFKDLLPSLCSPYGACYAYKRHPSFVLRSSPLGLGKQPFGKMQGQHCSSFYPMLPIPKATFAMQRGLLLLTRRVCKYPVETCEAGRVWWLRSTPKVGKGVFASHDRKANDNIVEIQKKKQKGHHNQEGNFGNNTPEKYNKYHTLPLFSTFVYKEWSHRFSFLEYFIWSAQKDDLTLPFYAHHHEITRNISYATRKNSLNFVKNKFLLHFAKNTSNIDFNIGNSSLLTCDLNRNSFASHRNPTYTLQSCEADDKLHILGMLPNHYTLRVSKQYPLADPTSLRQMNPKGYWKHWASVGSEAGRGIGFAKDMYKQESKPFALADPTKSGMKPFIPDFVGSARASQQGLWDSLKKGDVSITSRASYLRYGSEAATRPFGSASPGVLGSSEDLTTKLIDTQQFPRLAELLCFTGGTALRHLLSRFHLVLLGKILRHELKNLELKVNNLLALKILTYSQGLLLGKLAKRRSKQIRRLKLLELFQSQKSNPEWMILSVLPVLPPDLRPILRVNDDFVVASDLNRLYQTVLRRNNTIHERMDDPLPCPESGLFRQRSLQKAVDGLLENGKGGGAPLCASKRRPLVSLSHVLKGKKGLFRQHLLGKRVDYSGRSVIVVGPRLNLHECGLPKEMAMELFQPFLLHRLKIKGFALSNTAARRMIQQEDPVIWHILKQLVYEHPVLLNRAPTLHRLGIQAFQPRLVSGRAILLHPLVCSGFNADFDGDQMAVHVPLSFQARAEAWKIMWSKNNFLSPATGQPILVPSQDMVLGCYYLSVSVPRVLGFLTASKTEMNSIDNPAAAYPSGQQDRRSVHSINIPLAKRGSVNQSILATTRGSYLRYGSEAATIPLRVALQPEGVLGSHEWNTKFIAPLAWPSSSPLSRRDKGHPEEASPVLPSDSQLRKPRRGIGRKGVFASHSASTLYLHKNKGHYFSNLQDSLIAYFQGRLQTHTPFWVRVNQILLRSTNENIKTSSLETSIPKFCIPSSSFLSVGRNESEVASFERCLRSCETNEPLGVELKSKPPKVVKIVKSCSAFFTITKRRRVFSTDDNVGKELKLLQPKYGSSQEVCKILFQDSLHNIIIEGNDTLEAPLELRLSADGNLVKILTTFQNHYNYNATIIDQCKEKSEKFLRYMRTTAGRVVLNKALFLL